MRLLSLLLLSTVAAAQAQFIFTTNNGAITITAYTGAGGTVVIPSVTNGLPVTGIGTEAFQSSGITSVTIPNSVTNVGENAFTGCWGLTNVMIGSGVTSIGPWGFWECYALAAITVDTNNATYATVAGILFNKNQTTLIEYPGGQTGSYIIPDGVINIGDWAFGACPSLTGVTIPSTVTNVGQNAFVVCGSLTNVMIGSGVIGIGPDAFEACSALAAITVDTNNAVYTTVTGILFDRSQTTLIQYPGAKAGNYVIPDGVNNIGAGAFEECVSLTSVTIPNSVTNVGQSAFIDCWSLTNVMVGSGVISIGPYVFMDCRALTTITVDTNNAVYATVAGVLFNRSQTTLIQYPSGRGGTYMIPDGVINIGDWAFEGCTGLTGLTIPNSVTNIGMGAFNGCDSLTNVTMGSSVTNIGDEAFAYATNLTSISIPNSVVSIGTEAFAGCWSLTGVTIPYSVTNIGIGAFDTCYDLNEITVDPSNPAYSSLDGVLYNKSQTSLLEYPGGKASYIIPIGVTNIAYGAFVGANSLTNVTIPSTVTVINDTAFMSCYNLTSVYFEGSAPSLRGSWVFNSDDNAIVYYLPEITGWGTTFGGLPTALWLPRMETGNASFGVQTNQFDFNINWARGKVFVTEACTNLSNPVWVPVATNTLTNGSLYFSDSQWTNYPARFYRIRSP